LEFLSARARNVVMACYSMMIPHIVEGLPEEQASALRLQTKSPLQYSTIGLRNWRAFQELGIGMAMSPGNMHQAVLMDFPVSMGGYDYTRSPDHPCVLQMISCPYGPPRCADTSGSAATATAGALVRGLLRGEQRRPTAVGGEGVSGPRREGRGEARRGR